MTKLILVSCLLTILSYILKALFFCVTVSCITFCRMDVFSKKKKQNSYVQSLMIKILKELICC